MAAKLFERQAVVLLSGGPGSAYAALQAARQERMRLQACFVNYQQPDGIAAEEAAMYVAQRLAVTMTALEIEPPLPVDPRERMAVMLRVVVENGAERIYIGLDGVGTMFWASDISRLLKATVLTPCSIVPGLFRNVELRHAGIYHARLAP